MQALSNTLDSYSQVDTDFYSSLVPACVLDNLHPKYLIRPYQLEALGRFNFFINTQQPNHLLYHMATGSGKTLIMAGLILQLYEQGYRNFLFFVNSTNIIDKTRDNFLNPKSSKYLFAPLVTINHQPVNIKEVSNFEAINKNDINIVFTTIQGLHSNLQTPRENSITYDDFTDKPIVLLSDEAHHINAETKKDIGISKEEQEGLISWERTVQNIVTANQNNLLIEFTATADLSHPNIANKYTDKLIFNYHLHQFRQDGYSKEVTLLQTDATAFDMALQALIASQYRQLLFEQQQQAIKPVIMFKSKTIASSEAFYETFCNRLQQLTTQDVAQIKSKQTHGIVKDAFNFFAAQKVSLQDIVLMLQADFSTDKLLVVNSKDDSEQKQIAVNTLEDETNKYRAIFAVDKLNEGWDVLNLFDIVRLYESPKTTNKKADKTTVSEAQLIGRGARYCPFALPNKAIHFTRQFDGENEQPLRWCETLLYHCTYNPAYITELHTALVDIGVLANEKLSNPSIKQQEKIAKPSVRNATYLHEQLSTTVFEVTLHKGFTTQQSAFDKVEQSTAASVVTRCYLKDFDEAIIRKAIQQLPQYQFQKLKAQLPYINSISSFINDYLNAIQIEIKSEETTTANLSAVEKLAVCRDVLEQVGKIICS